MAGIIKIERFLAQAARRHSSSLPLVTLSYAQSLDGCLALQRGAALALSSPAALELTHHLRALHQTILIGSGTLLADDPRLNVRLVEGPDPQPVVLDSRLRFPLAARLLQGSRKPWILTAGPVDLHKKEALESLGAQVIALPSQPAGDLSLTAVLLVLAERGVQSLMVEGGARVITHFLSERLADVAVITIAPLFAGGLHSVDTPLLSEPGASAACLPHLIPMQSARFGVDLVVWGAIQYP